MGKTSGFKDYWEQDGRSGRCWGSSERSAEHAAPQTRRHPRHPSSIRVSKETHGTEKIKNKEIYPDMRDKVMWGCVGPRGNLSVPHIE